MTGYPLAAVLALRAREEGLARLAVARALAEEERLGAGREAAAARAAERRARLAGERAVPGGEGLPAGELRRRAAFVERLVRDVAALDAALRDADQALGIARGESERRRAELGEARAAVRALERHRDRWEAEAARRRERREEAAAEDVVSARRAGP